MDKVTLDNGFEGLFCKNDERSLYAKIEDRRKKKL